MTDTPEVGWHLDPYRRHEQRYYDGTQWTTHVANQGVSFVDDPNAGASVLAPPRPPVVGRGAPVQPRFVPMSTPTTPKYVPPRTIGGPTVLTGIGALLLIVGAFLPWAKVSAGLATVEASGVDADSGDGWVTFACGVVVLLALLFRNPKLRAGIALPPAAVAAWVAVSDLLDVREQIDEMSRIAAGMSVHMTVGVGLWASVAGAGVVLLGAVIMLGERD